MYKYLPPDQARLFPFKIWKSVTWLLSGDTLSTMALKKILGENYGMIEQKLSDYGLSFESLGDILAGKLPNYIQDFILDAEEEVDSRELLATQKAWVFRQLYIPQIDELKAEYLRNYFRKIFHFIIGVLPVEWQQWLHENLDRMGMSVESLLPLLDGRGTKEGYLKLAYGMMVKVETMLVSAFAFLKEQTGGDPEIRLFPALDPKGEPIVMVSIVIRTVEGEEKQETRHFPEMVNWMVAIIENMNNKGETDTPKIALPPVATELTPLLLAAPETNEDETTEVVE